MSSFTEREAASVVAALSDTIKNNASAHHHAYPFPTNNDNGFGNAIPKPVAKRATKKVAGRPRKKSKLPSNLAAAVAIANAGAAALEKSLALDLDSGGTRAGKRAKKKRPRKKAGRFQPRGRQEEAPADGVRR